MRMHGWGGVNGGGVISLFGVTNRRTKNYQNVIQRGLRWPPFYILHATTNQKHSGTMEKGWDRTCNRAVMLGESNSLILRAIELGGDET